MQINPLQALQFAAQGHQANSSIRARFWSFWAWLKNTVEARVNLFMIWMIILIAWRLFWSFAWPSIQFAGPECKDVQESCSACLTYTYYGANDCRWDDTEKACLTPVFGNFSLSQNHTMILNVAECDNMSCPAGLSGYVPFVCNGFAQFTFLCVTMLILIPVPIFLPNH
jgi:hypothetical protein